MTAEEDICITASFSAATDPALKTTNSPIEQTIPGAARLTDLQHALKQTKCLLRSLLWKVGLINTVPSNRRSSRPGFYPNLTDSAKGCSILPPSGESLNLLFIAYIYLPRCG